MYFLEHFTSCKSLDKRAVQNIQDTLILLAHYKCKIGDFTEHSSYTNIIGTL
jgi:hypothetical protein